jgi:hypothetical protein
MPVASDRTNRLTHGKKTMERGCLSKIRLFYSMNFRGGGVGACWARSDRFPGMEPIEKTIEPSGGLDRSSAESRAAWSCRSAESPDDRIRDAMTGPGRGRCVLSRCRPYLFVPRSIIDDRPTLQLRSRIRPGAPTAGATAFVPLLSVICAQQKAPA